MTYDFGAFNNWGQLKKVAVRKPIDAFVSDAKIDAEWKDFSTRRTFQSFGPALKIFSASAGTYIAVVLALMQKFNIPQQKIILSLHKL